MAQVLIRDDDVAAQLIERRRALGIDTYDEVWQGVYHVNPVGRWAHGRVQAQLITLLDGAAGEDRIPMGPMNLGVPADYRIPDACLLDGSRPGDEVFTPSALLIVEVRSSGDDTYEKFAFYAERGVQEIVVALPDDRAVEIYVQHRGQWQRTTRSEVLGMSETAIGEAIRW